MHTPHSLPKSYHAAPLMRPSKSHMLSDYTKTHFSEITHALSTPTSFSEITPPLQSESC